MAANCDYMGNVVWYVFRMLLIFSTIILISIISTGIFIHILSNMLRIPPLQYHRGGKIVFRSRLRMCHLLKREIQRTYTRNQWKYKKLKRSRSIYQSSAILRSHQTNNPITMAFVKVGIARYTPPPKSAQSKQWITWTELLKKPINVSLLFFL